MPSSDQRSEPHKAQLVLLILFVLSLPLLNPWVRGDGVGYYAFARAPLIQHNLDFTADYQHANPSFRDNRLDTNGQPSLEFRTRTGHLENHFSVGPAILWSPFLLLAHGGVLIARSFGSPIPADGFSAPYRIAMAFATALYGFLGLLLSFRLARKYVDDRWALLATIALWWASSLPVYMYFNPSWSHAHSVFAAALFLFYWHETRDHRTLCQWLILGAIGGVTLDVYYANLMLFAMLPLEAVHEYRLAFRGAAPTAPRVPQLLARHAAFAAAVFLCVLPTFISKLVVYGSPFESGYVHVRDWCWLSPYFLSVLFSSNHGLFSWTPLLLFALVGLIAFWRSVPRVGAAFLLIFVAFYYFIAAYPDWAGISSYGNRFFLSLAPLFVVGLAFLLDRFSRFFRTPRSAFAMFSVLLAAFVLWNVGLMFQWGTHLVPVRGPVSVPNMIRNQFTAVPKQLGSQLENYLFRRKAMMQQIEQRDLEQIKSNPPPP